MVASQEESLLVLLIPSFFQLRTTNEILKNILEKIITKKTFSKWDIASP